MGVRLVICLAEGAWTPEAGWCPVLTASYALYDSNCIQSKIFDGRQNSANISVQLLVRSL